MQVQNNNNSKSCIIPQHELESLGNMGQLRALANYSHYTTEIKANRVSEVRDNTYAIYKNPENSQYYMERVDRSGTPLTTLISPQYAKDLIAEFEQSMNKDSLVGSYYTLDGEHHNFKQIIEEDIQKGNILDLVNREESLMNIIYNDDIYVVNADPDNILADVVSNASNVQAGSIRKILNLYKDHSNRLAIEQMFEILTGVEFRDYLSDSINKMETAIHEYEESLSLT